MEKSRDRRVRMTRQMLKDALMEMLHDQDIHHVSVRALCQTANVNRSTFYRYYGSPLDLLTDMENDFLDFLSAAIRQHATDPVRIIETTCEYLEAHLEFGRLIVNNNVDPLFPQKLFSLSAVREAALTKYADENDKSAQEYRYNFITYGAYRIICIWLNKPQRESPAQIARLMSAFFSFA